MDNNIRNLIYQAIDQTISEQDFECLQDAIEQSEEVRVQYIRTVRLCETLGEVCDHAPGRESAAPERVVTLKPERSSAFDDARNAPVGWRLTASQLGIAAAVLIVVGGTAFWMGLSKVPQPSRQETTAEQRSESPESQIAGHATLSRAVDVKWSANSARRLEGDVLPNGTLAFDEGVAEIDFFCGATLIVEGPAELNIESDWSVRVASGRLRANVPPAARGFVVKAADSEIVDLGTEFALEVGLDSARVQVIDGEVELRGGEHDGEHLVTGEGQWLKGIQARPSGFDSLSTGMDLSRRRQDAQAKRFAQWKTDSIRLRTDPRLIAYYPIAESVVRRVVADASTQNSNLNGLIVGPVEQTTGRFGDQSTGLEFERPGARVRTRIDGEFEAFTFACWVRIDSLEHRYNALFMADSYQTGEPHWQIRDDGRLMFSVMVDDTQEVRHFSEVEQRMVDHAGLHRVYYSQPFWDISKSGQWFHLVAVYDPGNRRVRQYVNGEEVSSEEIIDKFHIKRLQIGASEIGNWGQPFRKSPWFAVRNLNGTIDELALFDTALAAEEIHNLYRQGKPLGY